MAVSLSGVATAMPVWLLMLWFAAGSALAQEAKPRLKYRAKGPVCMCASGLGEEDISRGMARSRLERLQEAAQENAPLPEKDSTQPTRRDANEDRK